MTDNTTPTPDADDVAGHLIKSGRSRPEDGKSGHGLRPQLDGDDDVAGHGAPLGATFPKATGAPSLTGALKDKQPTVDDQDDVSGHLAKSGRLQPEEAEVQGHLARGRGAYDSDDSDDTEGHASRGRV